MFYDFFFNDFRVLRLRPPIFKPHLDSPIYYNLYKICTTIAKTAKYK